MSFRTFTALITFQLLFLVQPISSVSAERGLNVVVSIKPLHSLVSSVMEGAGIPELLVEGQQSPHDVHLKPSQLHAIGAADLVIWMGPELETFLQKPLQTHKGSVGTLTLIEGEHEGYTDEKDDDPHLHGVSGLAHGWLDPIFAGEAVTSIQDKLALLDPSNAVIYEANAKRLREKIITLTAQVAEMVSPLKDKKFIFFHDAYQGFQRRFSIRAENFVLRNPHAPLGLRHAREIRNLVLDGGIDCVFSEPQFSKKLLDKIVEDSSINVAELDPLGADIAAGPDLYIQLMEKLALSLRSCAL